MSGIAPWRGYQPWDEVTIRRLNLTGTYYTPTPDTSPARITVNFEADLVAFTGLPDGSMATIKYPTTADRIGAFLWGGVWRFIDTTAIP